MNGRQAKAKRKGLSTMTRVMNFNLDTETPAKIFELIWVGWSVGGLILQRDEKTARTQGRLEGAVTKKLKAISVPLAATAEGDPNKRTLKKLDDDTWPILRLSQDEFNLLVKFTDVVSVWNTAVMDEVVEMWDWRDAADKVNEN